MNESDLQIYLREKYPKESSACEWKEYKNLTHAVSGRKGADIASYLSAIANMAGGHTLGRYRNPWLTQAMVSLNMIDTMGFGICTMTLSQRSRFFPLPDYSKSEENRVVLEIYGHVIDENYTRLLLENQDLPLSTVMLLDRVQKRLPITDHAAGLLRKRGLIEGRKPNYYAAAQVARSTGKQSDYIRNRAFNDVYYKDMVLDYLRQYGSATRLELVTLILDKLSDALDEKQKQNKFRNLLHSMSTRDQSIEKSGGLHKGRWIISARVRRRSLDKL